MKISLDSLSVAASILLSPRVKDLDHAEALLDDVAQLATKIEELLHDASEAHGELTIPSSDSPPLVVP